MTAIISGNTLGLVNNPLTPRGDAEFARAGQNDQVYLNVATGNLVVQSRDETLDSIGLDLSLIRTYNSQGQLTDDNADNWRLGVEERVYGLTGTLNTVGSTVTKTFGDGADILYTYDATAGVYVSSAGDGANDTLSYDSTSQQWTWTEGTSRVAETYNSSGQLIAARDADGNTTNYVYTGTLLTQITDPSGQTTYLDYSGNHLTQVRVVSGGQTQTLTRYSYDTQDRLAQVTVDLSPSDNSIADGNVYTTTYTYDGTSTRIASVTAGDGAAISFAYVLVGSQYRVASYTDGEGKVTTLTYTALSGGGTQTDVADPLGFVTTYLTDAQGRITEIRSPAVNGTRLITQYQYDSADNVTQVTDANGNVTAFAYDGNGNRTLSRDAAGNTVAYTYSATNQLLTQTTYLTPDPDGAGPATAGTPLTTRYVYDSEAHLRFTVSAEGRVNEYRYDASGERIAAITYTGATYDVSTVSPTTALSEAQLQTWVGAQDKTKTERTDYAYDFRGNLSSATAYATVDASGAGVADGAQAVTSFVYDQRGRLLQKI